MATAQLADALPAHIDSTSLAQLQAAVLACTPLSPARTTCKTCWRPRARGNGLCKACRHALALPWCVLPRPAPLIQGRDLRRPR